MLCTCSRAVYQLNCIPSSSCLLFFGGTGMNPGLRESTPLRLLFLCDVKAFSCSLAGRWSYKPYLTRISYLKVYNYIQTEGQLDWFQLLRWHTSGDILVANKTENAERQGNEEPHGNGTNKSHLPSIWRELYRPVPGHIWPRLSWKSLCVPSCCSLTRPKSLGCWNCVPDSSDHIHSACSALDALDEHYKFVKQMSYAGLTLVTPESKQEPILYLTSTQDKLMFLFPQAASWF